MTSLHVPTVRVQKTRVLFDATTHRNRLKSFGLGLESPWVPDGLGGLWNPTLWSAGPRVEPLPKTDAEITAYEAGWRVGFGRIEAGRVLAFHGWTERAIEAFWFGHRTGWQASDAERLAEQAEMDAKYDAMYAATGGDAQYGYE